VMCGTALRRWQVEMRTPVRECRLALTHAFHWRGHRPKGGFVEVLGIERALPHWFRAAGVMCFSFTLNSMMTTQPPSSSTASAYRQRGC
jgi:hypothetical protein